MPPAPILAVRVDDLGDKEAVLSAGHTGFFTIPHFDGYAAVLIELGAVGKRALREAILDGWAACAPATLVAEHHKRTSRSRTPLVARLLHTGIGYLGTASDRAVWARAGTLVDGPVRRS